MSRIQCGGVTSLKCQIQLQQSQFFNQMLNNGNWHGLCLYHFGSARASWMARCCKVLDRTNVAESSETGQRQNAAGVFCVPSLRRLLDCRRLAVRSVYLVI